LVSGKICLFFLDRGITHSNYSGKVGPTNPNLCFKYQELKVDKLCVTLKVAQKKWHKYFDKYLSFFLPLMIIELSIHHTYKLTIDV